MNLTEKILNKIKEMTSEEEASAPDGIAEAVCDLIEQSDHPVMRDNDQIYDAVHELVSLLIAEPGRYV